MSFGLKPKIGSDYCLLSFKTKEEDKEKTKEEVAASLTVTDELSTDAAVVPKLSHEKNGEWLR